jgi:DNA-directed RNA polymerase sigma subunit (sigma70/sigma32)
LVQVVKHVTSQQELSRFYQVLLDKMEQKEKRVIKERRGTRETVAHLG